MVQKDCPQCGSIDTVSLGTVDLFDKESGEWSGFVDKWSCYACGCNWRDIWRDEFNLERTEFLD